MVATASSSASSDAPTKPFRLSITLISIDTIKLDFSRQQPVIPDVTTTEHAPAALFTRDASHSEIFDHIHRLVDAREQELLAGRNCFVCSKPAHTLNSTVTAHFFIHDPCAEIFAKPVCERGGRCDKTAEMMDQLAMGAVNPTRGRLNDGCETCRSREKVSVCAGCKAVKYCSKECQRKDWSKHKEFCRLNSVELSTVD